MNKMTEPGMSGEREAGSEKSLKRPLVYFSPSIHDRRQRILKEARRLIAEKGIERFSVRELSRRAEVAQRTLYNAFYGKDRLIAVAIREAYDEVQNSIRYSTSATTIEGIIDRLITVNQRNFKARNYTQAVASLYFAPGIQVEVWKTLQDMVFQNLSQWLNHTQQSGEFQEWVVVSELGHDIANLEYSIINDWASGRIADEDYLRRLIEGVLRLVAGAVQGRARENVEELLRRIHRERVLPSFPKATWVPPPPPTSESNTTLPE